MASMRRSESETSKPAPRYHFTKTGVYIDPESRAAFLRRQAHTQPRGGLSLPQLRLAAYQQIVPSDWKPPPGFSAGVGGAVVYTSGPKQGHPSGMVTNDWNR